MCLERSQVVPLDVTVDAGEEGQARLGCTCDKDRRGRLLPSEENPCEWHFVFESLATPEHSKRVHSLNIDFYSRHRSSSAELVEFALGGCRFFCLSFPHLTNLGWKGAEAGRSNHIFSNSPFTPTIRSLSIKESWDGPFTQVNNLTSFTFASEDGFCAEALRLFMLNNRSLESLSLDILPFEGKPKGPPIDLLNLKSFTVVIWSDALSTIIRVPALQRLSSLRTSCRFGGGFEVFGLLATGDGIVLSVTAFLAGIVVAWQDLVGYARPIIHHVCLSGYRRDRFSYGNSSVVALLLADAHTLEVGCDYLPHWYDGFLDDLKQLGPQLKTIRFEVWGEMEPFTWGYQGEMCGGNLLDSIEELVIYRFEIGRPFSVVERMVVSKSERANRLQDYVWRCFYNDRKLGQYVQPI